MAHGAWLLHIFRGAAKYRSTTICFIALLALAFTAPVRMWADGCFVFKWDKKTDINEPTQKAIIVYDAGREDVLLQVKYEGPLEEFGWLIPVPSLPKVEKASMEAFYELSQITQRRFGATHDKATLTMSAGGRGEESVKVIEIKTVGAYEVAVLSAHDSGSLTRWLQAHDYSIPEGKSEIIDEYIRRGWFFIAAKIELNKGVAFKMASGASPKDYVASSKARTVMQKHLAGGELHPLLISFDTPKCIFPLKISAVSGKPSEVSIYVLSAEPLLNKFIFDKACEKLDERYVEWEKTKSQREKSRQISNQNMRTMSLAFQMYSQDSASGPAARVGQKRDWSVEDLAALSKEGQPMPTRLLDDEDFYASSEEILQCMRVAPDKIPQSVKSLPRLKNQNWYLTKQVWTFAPAEMQDLEFQPAIPAVAKILTKPTGGVAAQILSQFGSDAIATLVAAGKSSNMVERVNAVRGFEQLRDQHLVEPLLELLKDKAPLVRLHAVRAVEANWDRRFADLLLRLFRDPYPEIRGEATGCLSSHEPPDRTPIYLAMLNDPDPNVRMQALAVASWINRYKVSQEVFDESLKQLRDPNEDVQSSALHALWKMDHNAIPRGNLLPLLKSSRFETIAIAVQLIEGTGLIQRPLPESEASAREEQQRERRLSSAQASVLITNQLGQVRLMGLKILERNGDAKAVELTLPLLRDTNSVLRSRAFAVLRTISGQDVSENDPAKWDQWWTANKATFKSRR